MVAYPNLFKLTEERTPVETLSPTASELLETTSVHISVLPQHPPVKFSKEQIRSSLKASTFDGVFSAIFTSVTSGVLVSNFLLQLGATPMQIGMLSSIPMLLNFLQPLGAFLADRTTSRQRYGLTIFGSARLLWLILVLGIAWISWSHAESQQLVSWTLGMVLVTNLMGALGCPSWLSWMAALVPQRLRGRYFGIRSSAASLTALIGVPLLGLVVSTWPGGTIQGYGVVLCVGVVAGLMSLGCQFFMTDVNPQLIHGSEPEISEPRHWGRVFGLLREGNFLRFLLYLSLWTFAVNISSPFFNLYMLDNLAINVSWVTIYGSITAGANLLMLVVWGKLADRIGNRPLMVLVGVLVALTPLLWLGTGADSVSVWIWLPLLHLLTGGTWAAIDLCTNNLQMDVAPQRNQSTYFAIAAAVGGVSGALGTTAGGLLAQFAEVGGLPGLFALSAVLRVIALLPLVFVRENRSVRLRQVMRTALPFGKAQRLQADISQESGILLTRSLFSPRRQLKPVPADRPANLSE